MNGNEEKMCILCFVFGLFSMGFFMPFVKFLL